MKKTETSITKYLIIFIIGLVFLISNVSAKDIDRLPIIGSIVNINKLTTYFESGNNELDAIVPNIEYNDKLDASLNKEINNFTNQIINTFFKEYNEENHHYTKINYEIITDNEEWFTLRIDVLDIMASSDNYFKYYHIDKKNNKIITLNELFAYKEYKKVIVDEIKKQMEKRMQEDESLIYWINNDNTESDFNSIDDNQNFYFDKDENLVIVFNQGEVGPSSIGSQEFTIDQSIYKKYLKTNYLK